jgi:hypothetical protein
MGLEYIWIATLGDGLVRADQVVGIESHRTPELTGKPSRWLLDVTLVVPAGSGTVEGWEVAQLHRTLAQTDSEPTTACEELARMLDRLRRGRGAGILRAVPRHGTLRFEFTPFEVEEAEWIP